MISTIFQSVQPSHFFQGQWRSLWVWKQKQIPILNSKNNLAEFGKMGSAETVKNRVVPRETKNFDRLFETSLTHRQKTGWFWTVFRDIWTLIGKKLTNKQHLGAYHLQEPITRSGQLPCTRDKAFSRASLFLERFRPNLEYLLTGPQTSQQNLQT